MHLIPHVDTNNVVCLKDTVSNNLYYGGKGAGFSYFASGEVVRKSYCKVNGAWQDLIGTNIDDVNTGD